MGRYHGCSSPFLLKCSMAEDVFMFLSVELYIGYLSRPIRIPTLSLNTSGGTSSTYFHWVALANRETLGLGKY